MPDQTITARQWYCSNPESLIIEELDDDTVCYNRLSGNTHLLNALPTEVIKRVTQKAYTAKALSTEIANNYEIPCDDNWQTSIERTLEDLQRIHLISAKDQ